MRRKWRRAFDVAGVLAGSGGSRARLVQLVGRAERPASCTEVEVVTLDPVEVVTPALLHLEAFDQARR